MSDELATEAAKLGGSGLLGGLSLLIGQWAMSARRLRAEEAEAKARADSEAKREERLCALEASVASMDRKLDKLLDRNERRDKDADHQDAAMEEMRRELAAMDKRLARLEVRRESEGT